MTRTPGSLTARLISTARAPIGTLVAGLCLALTTAAVAQQPPAWTRPTEPRRLVGSIHYVGTEGLAAYLVKTRSGAILIDGTLEENVPAIKAGMARFGVRPRDVRLLLLSHAHHDHAAGIARLKRETGAKLVVGAADAAAMTTGVPPGETNYGVIRFPAAPVDRAIREGEQVRLGGVTLTAVATPGHTPGCTSWRMRVIERGRPLEVLFLCSVSVAGNRLIGNRAYPQIVTDFRQSLSRLAAMQADVVLPFHAEQTDLFRRHAEERLVDRTLLPRLTAEATKAFEVELKRQQTATP